MHTNVTGYGHVTCTVERYVRDESMCVCVCDAASPLTGSSLSVFPDDNLLHYQRGFQLRRVWLRSRKAVIPRWQHCDPDRVASERLQNGFAQLVKHFIGPSLPRMLIFASE